MQGRFSLLFIKAILYISFLSILPFILTPIAGALEIGTAEPFAWGPDDQYGTNARTAEIGMSKMEELGVTWHHEWISWKDWQPAGPGPLETNMDPSAVALLDRIVEMADLRGIDVFCLINNAPQWANGSSDSAHIPGNGDRDNVEFQQFVEDYSDFVSEVVSTYRGRIDHWEIWSEPDWNWNTDEPRTLQQKADGYAYMLEVTYKKAKEANPESVIIMGGPIAFWSDQYIQQLLEVGAGPYFDRANIHPYTNNAIASESPKFAKIGAMRDLLDQYGETDKRIWITEMGFTSNVSTIYWDYITEAEQATYIVDALDSVRKNYPSVEVATVFRLMDRPIYSSTDAESGFGLLYTDRYADGVITGHQLNDPKPSFYALKDYLSELENHQAELMLVSAYWQDYLAYTTRELTVDCDVVNRTSDPISDLTITNIRTSSNVLVLDALPLHIGYIPPLGQAPVSFRFRVPFAVASFIMYADMH
jgi:hypothetical protein